MIDPLRPNNDELRHALSTLADGYFIKDGKIYRTIGVHPHRGDDVDELVSIDPNESKYSVQITAWRLLQQLRNRCLNGEPHIMIDIPAHKRCRDCGYGRK